MKLTRLDEIEEYIKQNRSCSIEELCTQFGVSVNTIRRDIKELEQKGVLQKVYGGVRAAEDESLKVALQKFEARGIAHMKEKDAICQKAAELVEEGDTVFIDTGTTCRNLLQYISQKHCVVITNSLWVANSAVEYPDLELIMLPGLLKRETMSFVGMETVDAIRIYNIDKAFMASTGLTLRTGLTNASAYEYNIKKEAVKRSSSCYLLADSSKFGRAALYSYAEIDAMTKIITDREAPAEYADYCREHGVEIVVSAQEHAEVTT